MEGSVDTVAIGICQIKQGYDHEENLSKALRMIDEAARKGAAIAVLPEMFFTPYEPFSIRSSAPVAEKAVDFLKQRAKRNGITVIAGSMPWEGDGKRYFNRAFVFDCAGDIVYSHDKIHLFDCTPPGGPQVRESDVIVPGNSLGAFETPWGKASVIVCYDIRFTPVAQLLADHGVRMLFVPAAFSTATGKAHWEMLVRCRAVEMQAYVIGVQPAHNPSLKYVPYGHSMIASPWGEVLLDAGQEETVELVHIDLQRVNSIRSTFPLLAHRRKDLYETVWKVRS